jgi:hypothetical protein
MAIKGIYRISINSQNGVLINFLTPESVNVDEKQLHSVGKAPANALVRWSPIN